MTTDELVAAFLAKGGTITRVANEAQEREEQEREDNRYVSRSFERYEALRASTAPANPDWWAMQPITCADPYRALKDAAAVYVIARDEGARSARLFEKQLTH